MVDQFVILSLLASFLIVQFKSAASQCIPLDSAASLTGRDERDKEISDGGGFRVVEGDIAVDSRSNFLLQRQAFSYDELVWPDKTIPFAFHKCK